MGRPSTRSERREQILDAFETCVARFGVEGATLEKIAETAGVARPLIRHNLGNREDLLEALVKRFVERSEMSTARMMEALPEKDAAVGLVDILFDAKHSDTQFVLVAEALIAAAPDRPALAKSMRAWTRQFTAALEQVLRTDRPTTEPEVLSAVAVGIAGIYFNVESLTPLGSMKDVRQASKRAAELLLGSLK